MRRTLKKSGKFNYLSKCLIIFFVALLLFSPKGFTMLQQTLAVSMHSGQEWFPAISQEDVDFISEELSEAIYDWIGCSLDSGDLSEVISGTLIDISDEYYLAMIPEETIEKNCGSLKEFESVSFDDDIDVKHGKTRFVWQF